MAFLDNWDRLNSQPHHSDDPLPTHDGPTENHFSYTPPELSSTPSANYQGRHSEREEQQIARLKNDVITLQNEREQILNEQNSLRENQFDIVDRTRREVSANYDLKLANLQQALVSKEHQMQSMEQQLIDTKRALGEEDDKHQQDLSVRDEKYANALSEHEKMHAEMLSERERRHAEQLASRGSHQDVPAVLPDPDELEAERLKLIKEKLKELHSAEKKRILSEHEGEKRLIQSEFQRKIDDYYKQATSDANAKIKDMYDQFVTAHKAMEEQKSALEGNVSDLNSQVSTLRATAEQSELEKASIEEEYQRLRESHSAEIEIERRNSVTLEMKLKDWRDKAARLETDLVKSENQTTAKENEVETERDEAVTRMSSEYEEIIKSLQLQVEDIQAKLQESEACHQLELSASQTQCQQKYLAKLQEAEEHNQKQVEEIVAKYEEQLSEVRSDRASQVDLLEASVSEGTCSKGSLEVAEERMKSLQEHLNMYRNQEMNFEARIVDLNRQHAEDLTVVKMQLEERSTEVETVREQYTGQMAALGKQHSSQIEDFKHLLEVRKGQVSAQAEKSSSHHSNEELESLQQCLIETEGREARLQQDLKEMNTQMEVDTKRLQAEHGAQVAKLKELLSRVKAEAEVKLEERLKSLKAELADLSYEKSTWESGQKDLMSQLELSHRQRQELEHAITRLEAERKHLSEECDRFQKKAKNFEVDVSISRSAEEQNKLALERSDLTLQESLAALNTKDEDLTNLRAEFEELESEIERLRGEGETHEAEYHQLLDQMGAKNKSVADFQAENDSLGSTVEMLKRKQEEYADICEKLKSQLESSWGVNEELGVLKEQVIELVAYKENYGNMQQKVEFLEAMVRSKDVNLAALQEDIEKTAEMRSRLEESLTNASHEVESLKREMTRLLQLEGAVKAQLSPLETDFVDGTELNSLIEGMQVKIEQAESRCEMNVAEIDEMNCTIEELNTQLSLSQSRNEEFTETIAKNDRDVEELNTQLSLSKSRTDEYAEKIAKSDREIQVLNSRLSATTTAKESGTSEMEKMNRIITDLRTRMATVDDELAQKSQFVQDQNQTIEDLEAKLSLADADMTELQAERSRLELDLLQSQADPDSSNPDSEMQDLAQKYTDLQNVFDTVKRERAELLAEVNELRITSTTPSSKALEVRVKEQEKTIAELRNRLSQSNLSSRPFQSDLSFPRSPLEATLTRARQTLIEKLQEKAAIEKELGTRRATLECQKAEKQHLEDLLYEKKRFEQELQNQKTLLQTELAGLESRLGNSGTKVISQNVTTTKVN